MDRESIGNSLLMLLLIATDPCGLRSRRYSGRGRETLKSKALIKFSFRLFTFSLLQTLSQPY